jgi:hypothetical protein
MPMTKEQETRIMHTDAIWYERVMNMMIDGICEKRLASIEKINGKPFPEEERNRHIETYRAIMKTNQEHFEKALTESIYRDTPNGMNLVEIMQFVADRMK